MMFETLNQSGSGPAATPMIYSPEREAAFAEHLRATAYVLRVRIADAEPGPRRDQMRRRLDAIEAELPHRV